MARTVYGSRAARSNTAPSGVTQGTPGGRPSSMSGGPGRRIAVGDEMYLWLLVLLEVAVIGWLRKSFRRHHGG